MVGRSSPARGVGAAVAAAAALLASAARAQANEADAARKPTFARVEAKDGAPLANAVVTFAGCVPHVGPDVGPCDVQLVQTDARGRAQARLQPGLCYVAWAVGPEMRDGSRVTSDPYGWFGAGSLFTLRCGAPLAPRTLRVVGADAWAAQGPLRYVLWTMAPGPDAPVALDAQGALVVSPGPARTLEVQTADGVPLAHAILQDPVTIPPPHRLRVRACTEAGAPLAGASVRLRVGRFEGWRLDGFAVVAQDRWRALGVTGADGTCTVEVPYAGDPLRDQTQGNLMLFVGAPERPAVFGGVYSRELYVDNTKAPVTNERDELVFTCKPGTPLAGQVGRVPEGTVVQVAAMCKLLLKEGSYRSEPRVFSAKVAPDGKFSIDDVPADLHSCRFSLVPPSGVASAWPVFPAVRERALPPEVQPPGTAVLVGEGLGTIEVRISEPGGDPARGLVALLTPANQNGVSARDATVRFPLDARGTATLRVVPGRWVITAWSDSGWVARLLEVEADTVRETLAMQPHEMMRLELRGADGRAIADARVRTRGISVRGTGDPLQAILQSMRSQWATRWNNLRTDAEGRVTLTFVPVEGVTQKIGLMWDGGATDDLELQATSEWTVVSPK